MGELRRTGAVQPLRLRLDPHPRFIKMGNRALLDPRLEGFFDLGQLPKHFAVAFTSVPSLSPCANTSQKNSFVRCSGNNWYWVR